MLWSLRCAAGLHGNIPSKSCILTWVMMGLGGRMVVAVPSWDSMHRICRLYTLASRSTPSLLVALTSLTNSYPAARSSDEQYKYIGKYGFIQGFIHWNEEPFRSHNQPSRIGPGKGGIIITGYKLSEPMGRWHLTQIAAGPIDEHIQMFFSTRGRGVLEPDCN